MAKDGTNRGGARIGAGRKKKALSEKIAAGNPGHRPLTMIDSSTMEGVDMPPPSDSKIPQSINSTVTASKQLCGNFQDRKSQRFTRR